SVARAVDALHAIVLELADLRRRDRASTSAEDTNVLGATIAQHVDHVLEVLRVTTLVGADRDAVRVLLDRRPHDIRDAAVVPEVDDLDATILNQPTHHVDRSVVSVEQRGSRNEP